MVFLVAGKTLSQPKVFCFLGDDRQAQEKIINGKAILTERQGKASVSMWGEAGSTLPALPTRWQHRGPPPLPADVHRCPGALREPLCV